jgi:hypothetical protein
MNRSALGGEPKGHLVPADVDVRMVACGLGGVGHWVDDRVADQKWS